jgi:hypothetical protein
MSNVEPLIASELERMVPLPEGSRADWSEVLRRAGIADARRWRPSRASFTGQGGWRRWRSVLVAAVAVAALVGAGVAIAAGFGAFNGISAAQHPPTPADTLDPAVAASIAANDNPLGLEADSARFVTQLAGGIRIYAVATKTGELCALAERLPNNNGKNDAAATGCSSPLTQSQPTTIASFQANEATPPISYGIALDSVTAVSFMAGGQEVTVPVKNNVWAYEGDNSAISSLTVHFNDGRTETIK